MKNERLIIESVREDGKKFRPSDWIERISSTLATFGPDHRLHYDKCVYPGIVNGEKCLLVDPTLEKSNPDAYSYVLSFVESNSLRKRREQME